MKLILVFFILCLCPGVVMAIEEPQYTIVSKNEDYEVRKYESVIVAETTVNENFEDAGSIAFKILAGYIFGGNKSQTKIAMTAPVNQVPQVNSEKIEMTAPVAQTKGQSGFVVQFTMPKGFTLANLPIPNDSRVKLIEMPPRKVAVFTYSGTWSESRYQDKLGTFQEALKKNGLSTQGEPVFARYNSPFQIWFLRRNEIWINLGE
jgi:hypothetical protein